MNALAKRRMSLFLAVIVMIAMCFGGMGGAAEAHAAATASARTVFVVTGTGVIDNGKYTEENIGKEKAYTLGELKEIAKNDPKRAKDDQYLYSARNTRDNNTLYKVKGVRVDTVLAKSQVTDLSKDKICFIAADNYPVTFDPNGQPGTKKKANSTTAFGKERHYYPNIGKNNTNTTGETPVPSTITWEQGGSTGITTEPKAGNVKAHNNGGVRLAVGQLNIKDYNNPLWNGDTSCLTATVGGKLSSQLTIAGKAYTRADLLSKENVTREYTYSTTNGSKTAWAKGVPVSAFLGAYGNSDVVKFTTADGFNVKGLTKKQLIDGNYILAYEKGKTAGSMEAIFDTVDKNPKIHGYFTLYGKGQQPSKFINKATVSPVVPKAPASVKAYRTSYNGIKVSWSKVSGASGYVVYRYDIKAKAYKAIKTITSGSTAAYTNTGLKTGTKYTYRVKAYRSVAGKKLYSGYSAGKYAVPTLSKPAITKVSAGKRYATVKWKKISGANGYKIYRATSKKGKYKFVKTIKKGSTTSYKNKKLRKGKRYYYKIKAYRIVDKRYKYSSTSSVKYAKVK